MAPRGQRGWVYGTGRPRPRSLPLEPEITIEVRWRNGRFAVHGSPWDLDAFAIGYLVSEGIVGVRRRVPSVAVRGPRAGHALVVVDARGVARAPRRDNAIWGNGHNTLQARPRQGRRVRREDLDALAALMHSKEKELRVAGHLHWAALYRPKEGELLLASDISRHSALDKVIGKALLSGETVAGSLLYTTGRIGEEMAAKAARTGAAALATRSVPFGPAVRLAKRAHLVLVGRMKPREFFVYAGKERVTSGT